MKSIEVNPDEGGGPLPTDSLSQVLNLDPGLTYSISYLENARGGASPQVEVLVGGSPVVAQSVVTAVGGANPFELLTSSFTATDPTETLEFLVSQQNSNEDATFLVTNVSVSSAPEPGTAGLLLSALGIVGFALRRAK